MLIFQQLRERQRIRRLAASTPQSCIVTYDNDEQLYHEDAVFSDVATFVRTSSGRSGAQLR